MSLHGWYLDPGGHPGRYRYWDGATWSLRTTANPSDPPPFAPSPPTRPRSKSGLIVAVLALVVIVVIGVVVSTRNAGSGVSVDPPYRPPASTAGDDSSGTPTPSGTPSATTAGTASGAGAPVLVRCPTGQPAERAPHPDDGRVYGGNLSFAAATLFGPAGAESRLSFARDVAQQVLLVNNSPGWLAQLAVGQLRREDGFDRGARRTAERVAACVIGGIMYLPYDPVRSDRASKAITVSGHPGWLIETDVTVTNPRLPFSGDHVIFIVVRDGADWGMFFGATPIGSAPLTAILDSAVADLRAS
jgi:hypothetical protein